MGALRDYDECSFRHFEGVHVGRRVLNQAANRLRSLREVDGRGVSEVRGKPTGAAARGGGDGRADGEGGGEAEGGIALSPTEGEHGGSVGRAGISKSYELEPVVTGGGGDVEEVAVYGGNYRGNGTAAVNDSIAPDGGIAGWCAASVRGQEADRGAEIWDKPDGGGAVLASRSSLPIR